MLRVAAAASQLQAVSPSAPGRLALAYDIAY